MYDDLVIMIKREQFKKAKKFLKKEISKTPNSVYLYTQLANVLWNLGDSEGAFSITEQAKQIDSQYPLLYYTRGRIFMSLERFREAITEWNALISDDIEHLSESSFGKRWAFSVKNDALFYKAECLYHLYRDIDALSLVELHIKNRRKGLSSDFTIKDVRKFQQVLQYNERKEPSYNEINTSGFLKPTQVQQIEKKLESFEKNHQKKRLISYLKKKCREFPNEYWLKTCLAEYLYNFGEKECLTYARDAYRMAPNDMLVAYNYACALFLNCDYHIAKEILDIIIKKSIKEIAYGEHGEGLRWANNLVKDANSLYSKIDEVG